MSKVQVSLAGRRQEVMQQVATKHRLTLGQLCGKSRLSRIAMARHEWCYRARSELKLSLWRIGQITGGMDHSSVSYAIEKHASRNNLVVPKFRCDRNTSSVPLDAPLSQPDWWNDD